ncbi:hypothetical protein M407DRAFT_244709 [Tulasnella calospora MUT 4182]|uniref:Uncharacterized protein n=1 Tax=Tulasnella calospora MUT 4182 TaxID=1051891 RepID=A0A0C3QDD4_9AGAM|nr:hypothetical protein M407DRAFT_244709 [Tulasnella calospora MUT 4182]
MAIVLKTTPKSSAVSCKQFNDRFFVGTSLLQKRFGHVCHEPFSTSGSLSPTAPKV